MRNTMLSVAVCVPLLTSAVSAQWIEDFDSYAANSQIVGQGGWEEWAVGAGALVSNAQARSGANSVKIEGLTDLVHQYTGYTSGKWVYKTWQYVPSTMVGEGNFILLSQYASPAGPYVWAVQTWFNAATGLVRVDGGGAAYGASTTLLMDQWVELKVFIDLDEDWVQFFYNNELLDDPLVVDHPKLGGGWRWTGGPFGASAGALNIAALDLYANTSDGIYYDDFSLEQFEYESFGDGCPTSMGPISFNMLSPPTVGGVFLLEIGNLPFSQCFHVIGFSNATGPLGPLPLDLGPFGAPGCMLRVSVEFPMFLVGANNMATYALPLPNDPGLVGLELHQQVLAPDPVIGNALGAVVSDGMTIRIH